MHRLILIGLLGASCAPPATRHDTKTAADADVAVATERAPASAEMTQADAAKLGAALRSEGLAAKKAADSEALSRDCLSFEKCKPKCAPPSMNVSSALFGNPLAKTCHGPPDAHHQPYVYQTRTGEFWEVNLLMGRDGVEKDAKGSPKRTGRATARKEGGQLWYVIDYNKDGKLHGAKVRWWDDGSLFHVDIYQDGKLHGPAVSWHENGQLYGFGHYRDGKKHGAHFDWFENGQLESEESYQNGKKHGSNVEWHESGQLKLKATYKDGQLVTCHEGDC